MADDAVALVLRVLDEPTRGRQRSVSRLRRPPRHRPLLAARRARHGRAARSCAAAALSLARVRPHARVLADRLRAGQRGRQRRARVDGHSLGGASSRRTACSICTSGLGNFSLPLAQRAAELLGVEGEAGLVARAVRNAAANGIGNARFVTADLMASDWSFYRERWDVVVLDPPRTGAEAPVAELHLCQRAPHRLRIVPPGDARTRRASARGAAWVQAADGTRFRHVSAYASHRIPRAFYARLRRQSWLFAAIIAPCRVRSSASSCRRATRGAR